MTQVFRLPDLGEGLTEAEIVAWHVQVGDQVGVDQEVVTVETAKAAVEVPIPYGGTVSALHAEEGQVLPVGEPLITIGGQVVTGAGGEQYRTEERAGTRVPEDDQGAEDAPERPLIGYGASDQPVRRSGGRRRRRAAAPQARQSVRVISPLVRRLIQEAGVDPADITPGPTGVIRRADLDAHLAHLARPGTRFAPTGDTVGAPPGTRFVPTGDTVGAPPGTRFAPTGDTVGAAPGTRSAHREPTRVPIQGVHRIMVERLSTSRREIPDATTWVDVDATRLMKTKDALTSARPDAAIGVLPLLARIVVAGLTAYPALNASVDVEAGEIVQHGAVNLGFAAQSPRGLVVPVVHDAHSLTTIELAQRLRELTTKAREGTLSPAEMTGGTFTLNNYGVYGVDGSTPIINHPEAAMLGVGRIVDKPWVHKGRLKVRKVTQLSFTFDHRVCDGGTAGGFLRLVADCVEDPRTLLADL